MNDSTSTYKKQARELHRRRIVIGSKSTIEQAYAEVSCLDRYARVFNMSKLVYHDNNISLMTCDADNKSILIVYGFTLDHNLVYDRYIFVDNEGPVGWITYDILKGMDRFVDSSMFLDMPDEFRFEQEKICDSLAIWDYRKTCWNCLNCGKFHNDIKTKHWVSDHFTSNTIPS